MDADPGVKQALGQKLKEQEEVRNQISDLNKAINALRAMSLPVELTEAQFNAEVVPTKTGLKTRSKMLLNPPVKFQNVGYIIQGAPASDKKSRSARDEIQMEFPHLYTDKLNQLNEHNEGPVTIKLDTIDEGDAIKEGIVAVDKARVLLSGARKVTKSLREKKLRSPLLKTCDEWRASLNRGLQHYLNMVIAPLDSIGEGRTNIIISFGPGIPDRHFTICVMPNEKRSFRQPSRYHL